ncbi:MAG: Zn-ribbon domain-containing OB-fold protein [Nitrososphaerota archaeon]
MMPKSPRIWQLAERRYRLLGSKCTVCGKTSIGPRSVCPVCGSEKIETVQLPSTGKVYSYTVVHMLPAEKDGYGPYIMAIVELEDGTRLTAEIVDCEPEDVKIGMPVELAFRLIGQESEHGIIYYGYKFRPIISRT